MSSNNEYLRHILDEIEFLATETSGLSFNDFYTNATLRRACERSIEIIGEATKKLSAEFRAEHSSVDWRAMAGTRDKLIHDYFGVDYEILWDIIQNYLPDLKVKLEELS